MCAPFGLLDTVRGRRGIALWASGRLGSVQAGGDYYERRIICNLFDTLGHILIAECSLFSVSSLLAALAFAGLRVL